jgi:hypothetical protein
MKAIRRVLLLVLFALIAPMQTAVATSFSTDQSDLWQTSGEDGWAIQMVERNSVIFATMYVYAANTTPTWYVATMNPVGTLVWSGDLYTTTGPWFGTVPFNSANVTVRKVGTMTWSGPFVTSGTLTYDVDGVQVVKNLVRELLRFDDFTGTYIGALHGSAVNCTNPANNIANVEASGTLTVTQSGPFLTIDFSTLGVSITMTGALAQDGQFGNVNGTYTSSTGEAGNSLAFEMNVQFNAITMRFQQNSTNDGCQNSGYMGGIRSRPNG